jgi:hypothetical protein
LEDVSRHPWVTQYVNGKNKMSLLLYQCRLFVRVVDWIKRISILSILMIRLCSVFFCAWTTLCMFLCSIVDGDVHVTHSYCSSLDLCMKNVSLIKYQMMICFIQRLKSWSWTWITNGTSCSSMYLKRKWSIEYYFVIW